MRKLREIHLFLGCFFAPLLLFFVGTGWYQVFNVNRNKSIGEAGDLVSRLRSVHVDQIYPADGVAAYHPAPFKFLVVFMSVALIITTLIGVYLAARVVKAKWQVWLALGTGLLVPVLLLWLGQKR